MEKSITINQSVGFSSQVNKSSSDKNIDNNSLNGREDDVETFNKAVSGSQDTNKYQPKSDLKLSAESLLSLLGKAEIKSGNTVKYQELLNQKENNISNVIVNTETKECACQNDECQQSPSADLIVSKEHKGAKETNTSSIKENKIFTKENDQSPSTGVVNEKGNNRDSVIVKSEIKENEERNNAVMQKPSEVVESKKDLISEKNTKKLHNDENDVNWQILNQNNVYIANNASAPNQVTTERMSAIKIELIDKIIVSRAALDNNQIVKISLSETLLPGTEIFIQKVGQGLNVSFLTTNSNVSNFLNNSAYSLQQHLTEALTLKDVKITVSNNTSNTPQDGRSRNKYYQEEQLDDTN